MIEKSIGKCMKKIIFLVIYIATLCSWAQANEWASRYDQLLGQSPGNISSDTWRGALHSYFSKCAGGECKCLLVISEHKGNTAQYTWAGGFKGGSAQEVLATWGGQNYGAWSNNYNAPLTTCHTGNAIVSDGDGGDGCCVDKGGRDICSGKCRYFQNRADVLNIPADRRNRKIYFASTLSGPYYLHEEATKCDSPPCGRSAGCIRIYARAMKDLCTNYVGSNATALGRSFPENGGAYYYLRNSSNPAGGSRDQAIRGLERYQSSCGGQNLTALGSGGDDVVSAGGLSSYSSSSSSSSSGGYRNSGSGRGSGSGSGGGDFFSFLMQLFGGTASSYAEAGGSGSGASAGPASGSSGAYQKIAEQKQKNNVDFTDELN